MFKYPYGDSQQLNLDWILMKLKELEEREGQQITEDLEVISNALISATFSSSNAYNRSDIVFHDGKLYRANVNIPAPGESWNPAHWDEIMLGDTVANVVRYISSLNNTQVFNSSNVPGTHTSDALNNLKADINEVSGFHMMPFSSGGTVIEDFLNDELALISGSGLYFARRAYSAPNAQGYFGTHAVNILFYSDPTKQYISGIAFSDSAKQFATFRKRESLYEEMHYADDFTSINTAITNLNGVITSLQEQNNWYGKKLLIIGDSWSKGWTGAEYVERPWCDVMVTVLGCTADIIRQGSGGFTAKASSTAGNTYPNENFVEVLEHVKTNQYDAVVVQSGWNDIHNDNASDADLKTAMYNFATKCSSYFPKAKVFLIPSYPAWVMPQARFARALVLIQDGYYNGMNVCHYSMNWMFTHKSFRGADTPHMNQSGYSYFGRCAAAFLCGWDGKDIQAQKTWSRESGSTTKDELPFTPTLNSTDINANTGAFYVYYANGFVAVTLRFRVLTTATSGNITLLSGLPQPLLDGQYFNVNWYGTPPTNKVLPRVTTQPSGNLIMALNGDCSDTVLFITGSYQTKNNCIM